MDARAERPYIAGIHTVSGGFGVRFLTVYLLAGCCWVVHTVSGCFFREQGVGNRDLSASSASSARGVF